MKRKFFLLFFLLPVYFIGCKKEKVFIDKAQNPQYLTVATFNVEWLGDMVNDRIDRNPEDYRLIADIISKSGADIIALQEIENDKSLKFLIKYLPEFKFYVGEKGGMQNLGLLYKKNIKIKILGEYSPLIVAENRTRPGLIFECKYGNFDFIAMVVHLKSTSRYDNTREKQAESKTLRKTQIEKTYFWADSILKISKEEDVIILGDFNDTPNRKKDNLLIPFLSDTNFVFLTKDLKSCKYRNLHSIDHIVVTKATKYRYLQNSLRNFDFRSILRDDELDKISDHCPVLVKFDVSLPDND